MGIWEYIKAQDVAMEEEDIACFDTSTHNVDVDNVTFEVEAIAYSSSKTYLRWICRRQTNYSKLRLKVRFRLTMRLELEPKWIDLFFVYNVYSYTYIFMECLMSWVLYVFAYI